MRDGKQKARPNECELVTREKRSNEVRLGLFALLSPVFVEEGAQLRRGKYKNKKATASVCVNFHPSVRGRRLLYNGSSRLSLSLARRKTYPFAVQTVQVTQVCRLQSSNGSLGDERGYLGEE